MRTNCFCLCSPEASEAKWKKKPWNLSAFPSALEVRRVQRGHTSGVTELPRFHQQEVRCLWVSGVWDGGGRVDTCKPLMYFPDASHRNGTCWWDVLVGRLPHISSEQNLPSSRVRVRVLGSVEICCPTKVQCDLPQQAKVLRQMSGRIL